VRVVTFGCPVADDDPGADFFQNLGLLDGLGLANSWGTRPDAWPLEHHSTNTLIPFSMPVSLLVRIAEVMEAATSGHDRHPQIAGPSPTLVPTLDAATERLAV
jgi:hypothetical protein